MSLRLVGGSHPNSMKIIDVESGVELTNVLSLDYHVDPEGVVCTVRLHINEVDLIADEPIIITNKDIPF